MPTNDTPHAEEAAEFPGYHAGLRLGAALLVALFLMLVLVWRDNGRRAEMETTAEFTAVGDAHYFPFPASAPAPPFLAVASFHGAPLYPADFRRHEFQPDDMTRVGLDEKAGYIIYQAPARAKDADELKRGVVYYLKISPKEYLKVRDVAER